MTCCVNERELANLDHITQSQSALRLLNWSTGLLGLTQLNAKHRMAFFLLALSAAVSACETSTKRDCPAFFHPDYDLWAQDGVGETLKFTDQNGVTESFVVTEIERSEPFRGVGFGSRESNVSCDLTVREVLVRQDADETVVKLFKHGEFSDRDLADEVFSLSVDFTPETISKDFLISLDEQALSSSLQPMFAELEIGGLLYLDVITDEILDEQFLVDPDQVKAIAIASGFGLVQYTRLNGSVFSRVP